MEKSGTLLDAGSLKPLVSYAPAAAVTNSN